MKGATLLHIAIKGMILITLTLLGSIATKADSQQSATDNGVTCHNLPSSLTEYFTTPDDYIQRPVMVQIKANALWALVGTLNFGAEVQVDPSWSVDIPIIYSPYNMGSRRRKWRILALQPELRWWAKGQAGQGHFVGAHLSMAGFNIAFKGTERYQDPNRMAWGLGVGYGYALPLDKKHRVWADFNLGLGFINYKYVTYRNGGLGEPISHGHGTYWGITRLNVGIAYRWMWRHKQKGGGS